MPGIDLNAGSGVDDGGAGDGEFTKYLLNPHRARTGARDRRIRDRERIPAGNREAEMLEIDMIDDRTAGQTLDPQRAEGTTVEGQIVHIEGDIGADRIDENHT